MLMYMAMVCLISGSIGRSDNISSIQPHSNTEWGDWGEVDWCPEGTYANEFELRVEDDLESGDDTALNGIRLRCSSPCGTSDPAYISSTVGPWGGWTKMTPCPHRYSFISGAQVRSEAAVGLGLGDDTATNNYNFACTPNLNLNQTTLSLNQTQFIYGAGRDWGTWSEWEYCPSGSYICGVMTRVEPDLDLGDDTALNDAIFYCCQMDLSPICKEVYESRVPKDVLG